MFRVPRERQGGASWPQVHLVPSEPPRVSARPGGAPGGARGSHGELSFPARPRTALERGAPSWAAPRRRRPLQTQAGRPLRPLTQELRPSVALPRAATRQCRPPRPEGRAARSRFRRRDVGPERPSPAPELVPALPPPPWAPITPRTPLSRTRGGGRCAPFASRPPTWKCRPHTRAAASGLATSPTSARRRGPLAAPAPTLGRGSGRASGRGAGGPHAR